MHRYTRGLIGPFLALAAAAACSKAATPPPPPPAAAPVKITDIELGRAVGADKRISEKTDFFKPNDTIYVSIATEGSSAGVRLAAHWTYQDGQTVKHDEQSIAPTAMANTEFHIAKPGGWPAGDYKVEVMLDGASAGARSFKVSK
jgi:hypothetical protein